MSDSIPPSTIWMIYECEVWEPPRLVGAYTEEALAQARKTEVETLHKQYTKVAVRPRVTYRISAIALNTPFKSEGEECRDRICLVADPHFKLPHTLIGSTCSVCGHIIKDD